MSNTMKITICGSMAFAKEMLEIKQKLEKQNHVVIVPANTEKYANGIIDVENKWEKIEFDVICAYFEEIKKGAISLESGVRESRILFLAKPKEIFEKIKAFSQAGDVVLLESRVPSELKNLLWKLEK